MRPNNARSSVLVLVSALLLGFVVAFPASAGLPRNVVPTAPGLTKRSANASKLYVYTPQCRVVLESVDGRKVVTPPDAKKQICFLLEAGERILVLRDLETGQTQSLALNAQAEKNYGVFRYLANFVAEENGLRVFHFSEDVGVGIYEWVGERRPLVASPELATGFDRVSDGADPETAVLHLADQPLPAAESALLNLEPSIHILSIIGEDLADPKVRYDYQGRYLRGDERLPRLKNLLVGELPQIDYAYLVRERSVRFRPGHYKLLTFYQSADVYSAPAFVEFNATAGGRFAVKANPEFKLLQKDTWQPSIEPARE